MINHYITMNILQHIAGPQVFMGLRPEIIYGVYLATSQQLCKQQVCSERWSKTGFLKHFSQEH